MAAVTKDTIAWDMISCSMVQDGTFQSVCHLVIIILQEAHHQQ
jgi:hypothetical protein